MYLGLSEEAIVTLGGTLGVAIAAGFWAAVREVLAERRRPADPPPDDTIPRLRQSVQTVESESRQSVRRLHDRVDALNKRIDGMGERIDRLYERGN